MSLKDKAIQKNAGFRQKNIVIPEWEDARAIIREPSVHAWLIWQETLSEVNDNLPKVDIRKSHIKADAYLLASSLLEENGDLVFESEKDIDDLIKAYGPVHSRILKQALDLSDIGKAPIESAKKK